MFDESIRANGGFRRSMFAAIAFLGSLLVSAAFLHGLLPGVKVAVVSTKIDFLQSRRDHFDVFFVGTSRIHHQIIPALFDHLLRDAGIPTHSYNLGIDGLRTPEDYYVLENALTGRRRPMRWIVLECKDINLRMQDIDQGTARSSYWHDSSRMGILFRKWICDGFGGRSTFPQHLRQLRDDGEVLEKHCELYLQNELSVGALSDLSSTLTQRNARPSIEKGDSVSGDGYLSKGNPTVIPAEAISYDEKLEKLATKPATPDYGDGASQMLLRRERDLAAKYGAELVVVIPPTLKETKFTPEPALQSTIKLLDFDDPERYPELFMISNRRDETHLNERGAEIWTTLLAEELIRLGGTAQQAFPGAARPAVGAESALGMDAVHPPRTK